MSCRSRRLQGVRGGRNRTEKEEKKNDLLEEPFNIDNTLSVIPVGELSENVLGKIDVG